MQTKKLQMNGRVQWSSVEMEPMWRFCWWDLMEDLVDLEPMWRFCWRAPMWRNPLMEIYWTILWIWNLSWHGIDPHIMHWGWSSLMVTAWSNSMIFEKHCGFHTNVGESTCFVNSGDEKRYEFFFRGRNACMMMNANAWECLFMQECFMRCNVTYNGMQHNGMQHDAMNKFTEMRNKNDMGNQITKQPI